MYVSYLVLFAMLFYDHYLRPGGKHTKPANKPSTPADDRVHTKVTLCVDKVTPLAVPDMVT